MQNQSIKFSQYLSHLSVSDLNSLPVIPGFSKYVPLNGNVSTVFYDNFFYRFRKKKSGFRLFFQRLLEALLFIRLIFFFILFVFSYLIFYPKMFMGPDLSSGVVLSKRIINKNGIFVDDFFKCKTDKFIAYFSFKLDWFFFYTFFLGHNALCFCSLRDILWLLWKVVSRFFISFFYMYSNRLGVFSRDFAFEIGIIVGGSIANKVGGEPIKINVEGLAEEFGFFEGACKVSKDVVIEGICRVKFDPIMPNHWAVLWPSYATNLKKCFFWDEGFYGEFRKTQPDIHSDCYQTRVGIICEDVSNDPALQQPVTLVLWPQSWRRQFVILKFLFAIKTDVPIILSHHPSEPPPCIVFRLGVFCMLKSCEIVRGISSLNSVNVLLGYKSSVFDFADGENCEKYCIVDRSYPPVEINTVRMIEEFNIEIFVNAVERNARSEKVSHYDNV